MNRDKYQEKVPFRLTRMLVAAMEVSGIEGSYRSVSERVMRVMRKNKNSVMALLEAFLYDPLVNWRLTRAGEQVAQAGAGAAVVVAVVVAVEVAALVVALKVYHRRLFYKSPPHPTRLLTLLHQKWTGWLLPCCQ